MIVEFGFFLNYNGKMKIILLIYTKNQNIKYVLFR